MNIEAFSASANGELVREIDDRFGEYSAFVPHDLPLFVDLSPQLILELSNADRKLGELASEGRHLPNPGLLVDPLLRREAVLSVRIEGTHTYVADLYAYDAGQLSLFGDDAHDRLLAMREAQNYEGALRHGIERIRADPDAHLTVDLICQLHEMLLKGTRDAGAHPGKLREVQNWIGPSGSIEDATYVGPPPSALRARLMTLETNMNSYVALPPLIRLAQIHYQFEALHPFIDGNGRLGRLLLSLLLAKWDVLPQPILYLSGYLESHREDYYRHLREVTEQGAWNAWFAFFLRSVQSEATSTLQRIERFQHLHNQYRQTAAGESISANLTTIIDMLFELPIISAPRISERLGISQPAARNHIKRLESQGILVRVPTPRRAHWYVAREILSTIEG